MGILNSERSKENIDFAMIFFFFIDILETAFWVVEML